MAAKTKASKKKCGAPKGNQFWKARSSHGRKRIFETPETLLMACEEYFEWVDATPLKEAKVFLYQGDIVNAEVSKMRAMTIIGLCHFLDIARQTWENYKKNEDFIDITRHVEDIIFDYKFTGAAANLLNPNIIARELRLIDKQELTRANDGPVKVPFYLPENGR